MAKHAHSRDLHVRVSYGELLVHLTAEGVSYSPDALDDMRSTALQAFSEAWRLVEPHERFTVTMLEGVEVRADDEFTLEELIDEEHED